MIWLSSIRHWAKTVVELLATGRWLGLEWGRVRVVARRADGWLARPCGVGGLRIGIPTADDPASDTGDPTPFIIPSDAQGAILERHYCRTIAGQPTIGTSAQRQKPRRSISYVVRETTGVIVQGGHSPLRRPISLRVPKRFDFKFP